jgi:hypothetical protein
VLPVPTRVAANVVRLLLLLLATTKHLLEEMELRTRKSSKAQESEQRRKEGAHCEGSVSKEFVYWTGGKEGVWGHRAINAPGRNNSAKMASDWLQHFEIPSSLSHRSFLFNQNSHSKPHKIIHGV